MINEKNKEKVQKFYQVVSAMQNNRGREIGLLVIKNETLGDLSDLFANTNRVLTMDLALNQTEELINNLSEAIKNGLTVLIRLNEYLDPKVYNQLFLLAKANHMEFPRLEERIFVDAAKDAVIILVATDKELEKMNYQNIFDLIGLTERL